MVRGQLRQLGGLFFRRWQVALLQIARDQGHLALQETGPDFHGLLVRGDRLGKLIFRVTQQVALELPGVNGLGRLGQDLLDDLQGSVDVVPAGGKPCLQHPGRGVAGHSHEGALQHLLKTLLLALQAVGCRQRRQKIRPRCGVAQLDLGPLVDQLLALPLRQQRLRQFGQHHVLRVLEFHRLAQFRLCTHGVATLEQGHAQQIARLGQVRVLLQRILDLNDRRLAVVLGQIVLGRADQGVGAVAASDQQQGHQQRREGHFANRHG